MIIFHHIILLFGMMERKCKEDDYMNYENFIGEALELMHNKHKELIEKWCKESGVTTPVGYYNNHSGTIKIYTDRPGWLIGKGGENVNKFKDELEKEFNMKYNVEFIEIKGGIVNYETH